MWQPMFPELEPDGRADHARHERRARRDVRRRPDARAARPRRLGTAWLERAADPAVWEAVRDDPERGAVGGALRRRGPSSSATSAQRSQVDRLLRGEQIEYVARDRDRPRRRRPHDRLRPPLRDLQARPPAHPRPGAGATASSPARTPVQLLVSGKAHPSDEAGKDVLQRLYGFKRTEAAIGDRFVFVEDYDLDVAAHLVSGCDVWINLPRPPMEASGTSGMKATFNGGLQLSVLDGWWAEAYDGQNGWAIPGDGDTDPDVVDDLRCASGSTTCSSTR